MAGEPLPNIRIPHEAAVSLAHVVARPEVVRPDLDSESARQLHNDRRVVDSLKVSSGETLPHTLDDDLLVLRQRFSSERDADGRKVDPTNPDEQRWLTESRTIVSDVRRFLEAGDISPSIVSRARQYIEHASPIYREVFANQHAIGGDAAVNSFVEDLIRNNQGFRNALRETYVRLLDPKQNTSEAGNRVLQLQQAVDELRVSSGEYVSDAQLTAAQADLTRLETVATTGPDAVNLTEYQNDTRTIQELSSTINEAKKDKADPILQSQAQFIEDEIIRIRSSMGGMAVGSREYTEAAKELRKAETNPSYLKYKSAESTVQKYDAAKTRVDAITSSTTKRNSVENYLKAKQKLDELTQKRQGENPTERAKLESQLKLKLAELEDAKILLNAEKIKLFRDLTHMPNDAMQIFLTSALSEISEIYRTQRAERHQQSLDNAADKLKNIWKTRVTERRGLRHRVTYEYFRPDRQEAYRVVEAFLQNGRSGVDEYFRSIMRWTDRTLQQRFGFSAQEAAALRETFADNTRRAEFFKTHRESLMTSAVADYLSTGGKMSRGVVEAFCSTDLGQNYIKNGVEKRKESKKTIDSILGEDGVQGLGDKLRNSEWLKKNWWKIALIILMLAGIGLAGAARG